MVTVKGNPFDIDWTDQAAVVAYAIQFGPGHVVVRNRAENCFNIVHATRVGAKYRPEDIVHSTGAVHIASHEQRGIRR